MTSTLQHAIDQLVSSNAHKHLLHLQRGLEKESLRVDDASGKLAQTPHPAKLGSALTHPSITTDYSEALLEFVTPVFTDTSKLLQHLNDVHHFTYQHLQDEKLWVNSMPCIVEGEKFIPIARYGSSNVAKMKEAYRRGLGHRYGRLMQTIAGIHYNFSLPDAFWADYLPQSDNGQQIEDISAAYFGLIRNFHRHSWIGVYLFGASPAVCKTFLQGREHQLDEIDAHSFYAPHATSLRLSGLGYSNNAQSGIDICYNTLDDFVGSLRQAIQTSHGEYEAIGTDVDGIYQQLNSNLLQIENEFYAVIRPKRVTESGESPSVALHRRGVQYVEVRSLDLNPFSPQGLDIDCIHFMDLLLLTCLLSSHDDMCPQQRQQAADNRNNVVMQGRDPALEIVDHTGNAVPLKTAAMDLLDSMAPVAKMMDELHGDNRYQETLELQANKVNDPSLTPSARILSDMRNNDMSFYEFAMDAAEKHAAHYNDTPMDADLRQKMTEDAAQSLKQQVEIEAADTLSFDDFLKDYFDRQNAPLSTR